MRAQAAVTPTRCQALQAYPQRNIVIVKTSPAPQPWLWLTAFPLRGLRWDVSCIALWQPSTAFLTWRRPQSRGWTGPAPCCQTDSRVPSADGLSPPHQFANPPCAGSLRRALCQIM